MSSYQSSASQLVPLCTTMSPSSVLHKLLLQVISPPASFALETLHGEDQNLSSKSKAITGSECDSFELFHVALGLLWCLNSFCSVLLMSTCRRLSTFISLPQSAGPGTIRLLPIVLELLRHTFGRFARSFWKFRRRLWYPTHLTFRCRLRCCFFWNLSFSGFFGFFGPCSPTPQSPVLSKWCPTDFDQCAACAVNMKRVEWPRLLQANEELWSLELGWVTRGFRYIPKDTPKMDACKR